MKIFQKGFNFSQDGPGNRLVYHLQGCNMRCIWCSNPEGMKADGGKDCTPADIIEECKRSRMMFFSGGGVTFTGGEATLQYDELLSVLKLLKAEGIHTAIETNGTSKRLSELSAYIDYLIMDFKHYDGEKLKAYTGVGNEIIKFNFENNCRNKIRQHIRIPLIKGFNAENPDGFISYFTAFDTQNTVFEFLPYHEYGRDKWTDEYKVKDGFVSKETVVEFETKFRENSLTVVRT